MCNLSLQQENSGEVLKPFFIPDEVQLMQATTLLLIILPYLTDLRGKGKQEL